MATGVIELRLGACRTGPSKRLVADLDHTARQVNRAKNAVVGYWLTWRRQNPSWQPQQRTRRDGSPAVKKNGEPLMEHPAYSQEVERELYHVARRTAPELDTQIAAMIRNQVLDHLCAEMPYNHKGKKYVWEAVLNYERAAPSYQMRDNIVPVPTHNTILCYNGQRNRDLSSGVNAAVQVYGNDECVLRFGLFSSEADRKVTAPIVALKVKQLPRGSRRLLQRVANKEIPLLDSQLVKKQAKRRKGKKGKRRKTNRTYWAFNLTYKAPAKSTQSNPLRAAILWPLPGDATRPFLIEDPEGRHWLLGEGKSLKAEQVRLETRREQIRQHYTERNGSGHGRERFFQRIRPYKPAARAAQKQFMGRLLSEIERFLRKKDCGTLVYREPGLGCRQTATWFAGQDCYFEWTQFLSRLKYKASVWNVPLNVQRVSIKELRQRFGTGQGEEARD